MHTTAREAWTTLLRGPGANTPELGRLAGFMACLLQQMRRRLVRLAAQSPADGAHIQVRCRKGAWVRGRVRANVPEFASMAEGEGMRTRPADDERPAIFVLCDGVLSERGSLLARRLDDCALLPASMEGLHLLSRLDVPIFAVARQQNVSRDARTRAAERAYGARVCAALRQRGARVDAMLLMADPATDRERAHDEMERTLRRAARQHAIDLAASYVICDRWPEARAALSVGCQPLLVMTGRGRAEISWPQTSRVQELTWYAADLMMAALSIDVNLTHAWVVPPDDLPLPATPRCAARKTSTVA